MFTAMRGDYLRHSLDLAMDYWWERQELPPVDLLRESLLLLERGERLDEGHRALLLRSALYYGKGVLTALRHQTDPDRTAVLLNDALTGTGSRWTALDLATWLIQDPHSIEWRTYLQEELAATNQLALPAQRKRIASLLKTLEKVAPNSKAVIPLELMDDWAGGATVAATSRASALRYGMALILLALIGYFFFQRYWPRWDRSDMLEVRALLQPVSPLQFAPPAQPDSPLLVALVTHGDLLANNSAGANGTLPTPSNEREQLEVRSVWLDRSEVTNAQYRVCISSSVCDWPASRDSATRSDYLLDPHYDDFPVVNVDLAGAIQYCAFRNKRLPTADEWETAATLAPATARHYRYPWGDQFATQFANSLEAANGDTTRVGFYRPRGNSPLGFDDMAGNVAEWTMTLVTQDNKTQAVVKGGSYQDDAVALAADSLQLVDIDATAPWIGFRCAR